MASEKNKPTNTSNAPDPKALIAKALAELGMSAENFETVGGLVPMVPAEVSFNHKTPVAGILIGKHAMPKRDSLNKKGEKEDWNSYLIHLIAPTVAMQGTDIMTVEAKKEVRIPENGNLRNNAELQIAAADPEHVYVVLFEVTGQLDTGKPTAMWLYDTKVNFKQPIKRSSNVLYGVRPSPKELQEGKDRPALPAAGDTASQPTA